MDITSLMPAFSDLVYNEDPRLNEFMVKHFIKPLEYIKPNDLSAYHQNIATIVLQENIIDHMSVDILENIYELCYQNNITIVSNNIGYKFMYTKITKFITTNSRTYLNQCKSAIKYINSDAAINIINTLMNDPCSTMITHRIYMDIMSIFKNIPFIKYSSLCDVIMKPMIAAEQIDQLFSTLYSENKETLSQFARNSIIRLFNSNDSHGTRDTINIIYAYFPELFTKELFGIILNDPNSKLDRKIKCDIFTHMLILISPTSEIIKYIIKFAIHRNFTYILMHVFDCMNWPIENRINLLWNHKKADILISQQALFKMFDMYDFTYNFITTLYKKSIMNNDEFGIKFLNYIYQSNISIMNESNEIIPKIGKIMFFNINVSNEKCPGECMVCYNSTKIINLNCCDSINKHLCCEDCLEIIIKQAEDHNSTPTCPCCRRNIDDISNMIQYI